MIEAGYMSKSLSRHEKLERWENSYPRDFPGRIPVSDISYDASIKIAGRISARRNHGNNVFFDLFDQTGTVQLHCKKEKGSGEIDEAFSDRIKNLDWDAIQSADLGDCVGVEGTLGANPRGEPLFRVEKWTLLAKALKEPGDKFHGVNNPEIKYRHRELDLLSSADSRRVFEMRAKIIFGIRKWLNDRGYVEIECPVLQSVYGGATAKPFKTKHNALGQDFYLSISSELYLKRALVGGFDRVYSVSRCFRNEGISPEHNPEFTNIEIFSTCETYETMKSLTTDLFEYIAHSVGSLVPPLDCRMGMSAADWPLTRTHSDGNVDYAEAYEMEIASGATDLNDPREQEARLKGVWKDMNDDGYNPYDPNYIEALEQGALPWAGVGIGLDRLCMLLLGKTNIRDVVMFPLLKP